MGVFEEAIDSLRLASDMSKEFYGKPLLVCYSGGKDSDALVQLCLDSGIEFECSHSLTSVDAPQTVMHVRKTFSELEDKGVNCTVNRPYYKGKRTCMWDLIPQMLMPPTRLIRYCCKVLKETTAKDRIKAFGVRKSESTSRKVRDSFEIIGKTKAQAARWNLQDAGEVFESSHELPEIFDCNLIAKMKEHGNTACNPMINWTERNVIDYLHDSERELNQLYQMGYYRVGCIMCPIGGAKSMLKEAAMFPKYKAAYLRAFERMIAERKRRGFETQWANGEEVMHWWIDDGVIPNQLEMEL